MNWHEVVEKVTPSIVKVETPSGHGTGFLCLYNAEKNLCGIATANHVLQHAERWHEPIRLFHPTSNGNALLLQSDRVIFPDIYRDSAVLVFPVGTLNLPEQVIPLLPANNRLPIGMEIGWLGFPGIGDDALCFFSGTVSAWRDFHKAYLIDGVAIPGVSGGPVVYFNDEAGVQIVGAITAYRPNRLAGEALPGLSVAQDVSHFHDIVVHMNSIQEASKKKESIEQQQEAESTAPPETLPPNAGPATEA